MNERYPHLFSPLKLGRLTLKNRLVVPGLTTNFAESDGAVGDALCRYLAERAAGGFGLIVTENMGVAPGGRVMPRMVMADDDRYIPGLQRLARDVHDKGGTVFAQLSHAGRQTRSRITGESLVAASAIPCPINREMPRALDTDEVMDYVDKYVAAAVRVAEAGFDGVEIHGAHGYLVAGFLSAYSNRREDRWGGAIEQRMRFLLQIVDGIQVKLGRDFPISVRISAREFVAGGNDIPEAIAIGRALAARGVGALSISVGVYESFNRISMVSGDPEGQWLETAAAVKAAVPIPVMGVGRIRRAAMAEQALAKGQIDLACIGRGSIADPGFAAKVKAGRENRIVACVGCNLCLGRSSRPETICPVNPAVGREAHYDFTPVAAPRRIAVLGAGYAALTAAWIAAARGHQVTLHHLGQPIGGLQALRGRVPGQEELLDGADALLARAVDAGVTVSEYRPDPVTLQGAVIWAERRFAPRLASPTANGRHCSALDILLGMPVAVRRAVVFGDDLLSAEAAILLANRGIGVELRSPAKGIVMDAHPGFREVSLRHLNARGVAVRAGQSLDEVETDLLVLGRDPQAKWEDAAHWAPVYPGIAPAAWIGDAYEAGLLGRAVYEAAALALAA